MGCNDVERPVENLLFAACLKFNVYFFDIIKGREHAKSCFQINSLCWRYKQLLYKSTPTLEVQTLAF